MNWISSGIERKTSSTAPSNALIHDDATARSTPNTKPITVPPSTAQKVSARVMLAPCSMNHRSVRAKSVSIIAAP